MYYLPSLLFHCATVFIKIKTTNRPNGPNFLVHVRFKVQLVSIYSHWLVRWRASWPPWSKTVLGPTVTLFLDCLTVRTIDYNDHLDTRPNNGSIVQLFLVVQSGVGGVGRRYSYNILYTIHNWRNMSNKEDLSKALLRLEYVSSCFLIYDDTLEHERHMFSSDSIKGTFHNCRHASITLPGRTCQKLFRWSDSIVRMDPSFFQLANREIDLYNQQIDKYNNYEIDTIPMPPKK